MLTVGFEKKRRNLINRALSSAMSTYLSPGIKLVKAMCILFADAVHC